MILMAREITKDVEAERKKRFAAVKIPEKTVKEYTPAGLMVEKKKEKPWGNALPKTASLPSFPPIGSAVGVSFQGRKENEGVPQRKAMSVSPREESVSRSHTLFPSLKETLPRSSFESHLYAPPLPTQQKQVLPAELAKFGTWGAHQEDPVEKAFRKAMKEKEEGKKKGKKSRGVKLEF